MNPSFDRLTHRVQVERLVPLGPGRIDNGLAEQRQCLVLRRRGEREERQIRLPAASRGGLGEQVLNIPHRNLRGSVRALRGDEGLVPGEPSRVALTAAGPAHRRPRRPACRASSSSRPVSPAASSFASADR